MNIELSEVVKIISAGYSADEVLRAVENNDVVRLLSLTPVEAVTDPDRELADRLARVLNEVSENNGARVKVDGELRGWAIGKWSVWYPGPGLGGWQVRKGQV